MYPNNTPCLDLETKGSYSQAVIGILLITITLTFGLSVLGVWEYGNKNGVLSDVYKTPFIPDNAPSENSFTEDQSSETSSSEGEVSEKSPSETTIAIDADPSFDDTISGTSDVSVLEKGMFGPFETEPGTIEIVDEHTVLPEGDLPLCITQDWLDQYYMMVAVKGGYEPLDGKIILFQGKDDECIDGVIDIEWTQVELPLEHCDDYAECCWTFWVATLHLCDGPICLESSQAPIVGSDFVVCPPDVDLMKQVYLCVKTMWTGCPLPDQHFIVILAHKTMSQKLIPNSR